MLKPRQRSKVKSPLKLDDEPDLGTPDGEDTPLSHIQHARLAQQFIDTINTAGLVITCHLVGCQRFRQYVQRKYTSRGLFLKTCPPRDDQKLSQLLRLSVVHHKMKNWIATCELYVFSSRQTSSRKSVNTATSSGSPPSSTSSSTSSSSLLLFAGDPSYPYSSGGTPNPPT